MRRRINSNMHRALGVPEVLLIIFKYITDDSGKPLLPTLAAIARTCRSFQRHVEGILWYKLVNFSTLFNILPPRVRNRESRGWTLNRRSFSGDDWARYLDRASRVRVLIENTPQDGCGRHERSSSIFLAMAALRNPVLLTPNLRKLEWKTSHASLHPAINLFICPSLESLEIDAKLIINGIIRVPLADTCPRLRNLKIHGNARSAAGTISSILRQLHYLEAVACSTLDNDAFVHLAQLKSLSYLAIDMRWSVLCMDTVCDHLCPGSFVALQTLCWKDYDLQALADIFLMPGISPSNIHLEIESFCTSSSIRTFFHTFAVKFPHTRGFSLAYDVEAGKRFGIQASAPGREHQLDARDLEPLLALTSLRALTLVDLGDLRLDDDLVKTIATALPELEQLRLDTGVHAPTLITFDGLLNLLRRCPRLRSLGVRIDVDELLSTSHLDTPVRHDRMRQVRLEGSVLTRRAEVDALLKRVMPGLRTVEESVDGVTWHVREMNVDAKVSMAVGRRRRRNSLENEC